MANKQSKPQLYVVAGPNGAGKTTFAKEFLPHFAKCNEFINTDLIASGLSPFNPKTAAIEAARLVLKRIKELSAQKKTFAIETTLSGKSYKFLFQKLRKKGYTITLFYLWIPNVQIAIQRVKDRVRRGGHDVAEPDIKRRFARGLNNLFSGYADLFDKSLLFDNSGSLPHLVAIKNKGILEILDKPLYDSIKRKFQG